MMAAYEYSAWDPPEMEEGSKTLPSNKKKKGGLFDSLGRLFSRSHTDNPKKRTKGRRPLERASSDAGDLHNGFKRSFGQGVRSSFHMVSPYDHISPNSVFSKDGIEIPARRKSNSVPSRPVAKHDTPPLELPDKPKQVRPALRNVFDTNSRPTQAEDNFPPTELSSDRRHPEAQTQPELKFQSHLPSHSHSRSQDSSRSSDQDLELPAVRPRSAGRRHSRPKSIGGDSVASGASSSSERSLERSHRRIAGKKSLEPLAAYSQSQRTDHPQRQHRSPTDPRYFPPPPMMMYPQPYPGMYPYAYPPMVPGYLPYYLPHPEEVPVVLNVIKEEGSTQDSEVSLPTLPPPASAQKRPPSSDPPAGLDEFVLY